MDCTRRTFLHSALAGSICAAGAVSAAHAQEKPTPKPSSGKLNMLILGGTSILGPHIVQQAVARGHSMTLFNRGKTRPELFPDLEKLRGDRDTHDLAALEGREFDVIIDTSAYVPSHVEATAGMFADCARQYVLLSSISALADHSSPADEDSPVAEISDERCAELRTIREALAEYGAMKARCEVAAEAAMPGKALKIRPGLISGPGDFSDRFGYWAVRVADGGEILAPGDGLDPVQYIDVRDLAEWILRCVEQQVNGLYSAITPPGRFTFAELLYGMKASVVTDANFTWVHEDFLEENGVQGWTHMPVWMPRSEEEVAGFHLVSSDRAVAAGLAYRPLAETARDTVSWYREKRPADYEFGRRAGVSRAREAELLAAWTNWTPGAKKAEAAAEGETEMDAAPADEDT
jgi:2'-hydroxyisoflavone reductase